MFKIKFLQNALNAKSSSFNELQSIYENLVDKDKMPFFITQKMESLAKRWSELEKKIVNSPAENLANSQKVTTTVVSDKIKKTNEAAIIEKVSDIPEDIKPDEPEFKIEVAQE